MTKTMRRLAAGASLAFASVAGGCATGGWDDVLYGDPSRSGYEVTGEVRRVDTRDRTIQIREEDGRDLRVRYDGDTRVVYRGRRYRATALERGDFVTVRVDRDRRGAPYARNVVVRRDAADRHGREPDRATPSRGRQTLEGRVGRVQRSEGRFQLRTGTRTVWVALPYRPGGSVEDRFRRLRQGEHVRVQGVWLNPQRFEIERFR